MDDRNAPLRIGLKFCGGCKPDYDRVELVRKVRERLRGKIELVPHDNPYLAMGLAVEGCNTACADLSSFESLPVWIITCEGDAQRFIQYIEARTGDEQKTG